MKYPWTDSQNDVWADSVEYSWGPTTSGSESDENTLILPPFRTEIVFSISEVTGSIIIELPTFVIEENFVFSDFHMGYPYPIDTVNKYRMKRVMGIAIKNIRSFNHASKEYVELLSKPDNTFEEGSIKSFTTLSS